MTQLPHVKELREMECMFLFYHRFYLFAKMGIIIAIGNQTICLEMDHIQ